MLLEETKGISNVLWNLLDVNATFTGEGAFHFHFTAKAKAVTFPEGFNLELNTSIVKA